MILPPQKLSIAEKLKRDDVTGKNNIEETIDYYISQCSWSSINNEILLLYEAVEGKIRSDRYSYVQNPFNVEDNGKSTMYSARLRNFNIIKGIVNLLTGEFTRRSHEYTVFHFNPTAEVSYTDALNFALKDYYKQQIVNTLSDLGFIDEAQKKELPTLEDYTANFKATFTDTRIITGQDALDYIKYNCELESKYVDMYWDWVIIGRIYTYKTVRHNDIYWEPVPANEIFIPSHTRSRFGEDAPYAVRRQIVEPFELVDMFRGELDEEIIDEIESTIIKGYQLNFNEVQFIGREGVMRIPTMNYVDNQLDSQITTMSSTGIELFHVQYRTWRKYGELTYIDPVVGETTMEVDDTYKLNKEAGDISITWMYESQIMSGYRVFDFYLQVEPLAWNRGETDTNVYQKLEYNSLVERSKTSEIQSIVKQGIEYQELVNIIYYQTEKLINKNKDKILIMPYGLINKKKGMTAKSTMYHADNTSLLWVDETAPNAAIAGQMIKSVDMSLGNYIRDSYDIIGKIKSAYWEEIGMTPQRYADIGERAGKATTEQAIIRSATITNELVRQFDYFIGKDYVGLLDLSKWAWIDGTKGKYIRSDGSEAFLELNADNAILHTETSYGIFVKDASENTEAVNAMRQQGLNLIQNGAPLDSVSKLYSTKNLSKLDKIMEDMEAHKKQFEQLMQQQEQEAAQALQDSVNENDRANREAEKYKVDSDYAKTVDAARIRANAGISNTNDIDSSPNDLDIEMAQHKKDMDERTISNKERETMIKEKKLAVDAKKE